MTVNEFPTLYSVDSKGKVKVWTVMVLHNPTDHTAIIRKIYGRDGEKMQINDKTISQGKNIGKSNETSAYEQAVSEANSNWKKQIDKGYSETKSKSGATINGTMLAQNFKNRSHDIIYPAYTQPKLNGIRCLAKNVGGKTVKYYSKNGKSLDAFLGHLTESLLSITSPGEVVDGELYKHDWSFQQIASHSKRLQPTSSQLEFWVFDMVKVGETFEQSYYILLDRLQKDLPLIKLVRCDAVANADGVKIRHDQYVKEGYEGVIVRNAGGLYRIGYRSSDIQKYKEFEDKEFPIMDGHEGTGQEDGCVIFECMAENGEIFSVRPKGSRDKRQRWWKDLYNIVGKQLTVRFQERSDGGIPIFPVGIAIRDYE